jgi:hypothetical protein
MKFLAVSRTARILGGLLLLCGAASANSVIMATGVDWSRGGSLVIREDDQDVQAYFAGVIFISLTEGGHVYNRDTLCVDLFTDINLGQQYNSNLLRPDQVAPSKNLSRVSWLVENALLPGQDSNYGSELQQVDWVLSAAQGAGLQFAIWDIVHDGGDGFFAGRVQAATNQSSATDPVILNWAQRYEAVSLTKTNNAAYVYNNVQIGDGSLAQMLIGPQFSTGPEPVPEPDTLAPAGVALILLSLMLRKWLRAGRGGNRPGRGPGGGEALRDT